LVCSALVVNKRTHYYYY